MTHSHNDTASLAEIKTAGDDGCGEMLATFLLNIVEGKNIIKSLIIV